VGQTLSSATIGDSRRRKGQTGRSAQPTRPVRPGDLFGFGNDDLPKHGNRVRTSGTTLARSVDLTILGLPLAERKCRRKATRNPLLLLRLPGAFLLRLAARQFLALLFQEPPRKTRALATLPRQWYRPCIGRNSESRRKRGDGGGTASRGGVNGIEQGQGSGRFLDGALGQKASEANGRRDVR
jgi:hypothetical protein